MPCFFSCEEQHYLPESVARCPCGFILDYSGSCIKKAQREHALRKKLLQKNTSSVKLCNDERKRLYSNYLNSLDLFLLLKIPSIIQLPNIGFLSYGWVLRLHVQNRDLKHVISHHRILFLKGCALPHETKMGPSFSLLHEMSPTIASLTPLEMGILVSGSLTVKISET